MKRFLAIGFLVLLAVGGLVWLRVGGHKPAAAQADAAIPVGTAVAALADVPLTVDGIGTVQALNTVNIRPMVDGPLTEIRFREGQDVRAGDVLARIDARTYQAAYDQAVAKKAQDEATLANAQRDLARYDKLARKTSTAPPSKPIPSAARWRKDEALVRQDQAQVDTARTNLGYTTIIAPVDGRTGIRQVDLGNSGAQHGRDADHGGDHAAADLGGIHAAAADAAAGRGGHRGGAGNAGGAAVEALPQDGGGDPDGAARSTRRARPRPGCRAGQRGRSEHRHHQAEGDVPQPGVCACGPAPSSTSGWRCAWIGVWSPCRQRRSSAGRKGRSCSSWALTIWRIATPITIARQDETVAVVSSGLQAGQMVVTDGASRLTEGSHVRRLGNANTRWAGELNIRGGTRTRAERPLNKGLESVTERSRRVQAEDAPVRNASVQ